MRLAVIFAKLKATDRSTLFATRRNFGPNPYSRRSSAIWRTSFVDFAEPSRSRPAGLLVEAERAVKLGDFSSVANNLADPVAFNVAFDTRRRTPGGDSAVLVEREGVSVPCHAGIVRVASNRPLSCPLAHGGPKFVCRISRHNNAAVV